MEIQSAFNSGVQGFNDATQQASEAAANIVDATVVTQPSQSTEQNTENLASSRSIPNLNQELVDLKVAEYQAKASANVIKTADEALGTLLDVTA